VIAVALAALAPGGCPHDASLGKLTYVRGSTARLVSFADCSDRTVRKAAPAPAVPAAAERRLVAARPPDWTPRQPASTDAPFFDARWQPWRVGLDGLALLFVRERRGNGRAVLLRDGTLFSVARLGYSLGFFGHHDGWAGATWRA
jgi:hypothetical protein